MNRRACWVWLCGLLCSATAVGQIGFAENQADRIRLWNTDFYEFAFRKADGRLLYILDSTTGGQVSTGNIFGPWVLRFSDGTWLDGTNFSPSNGNRLFSYNWDAQDELLTLQYEAGGTYDVDVTLTFAPGNGPELDSVLTLVNNSAFDVELLAYPVQLSFLRSQIESVYVPYMEGMQLLPSFFPNNDFSTRYPGQMFADFAFTEMVGGCFAVYGIHEPNQPLTATDWKILRDNFAGGVAKYHHDYTLQVEPGQTWVSPTIVISVGASLAEAMDDYWVRNGHDQMPTLEDKLGPGGRDQLAESVLLKADFLQGNWTFASFASFAANLPVGNLMHLVAFWQVGFDEQYPDYLPTNPSLGSTADLQGLVTQLQNDGHLVMPYTNPTWWDDQSPTLASLGTGIVSRNRDGSLIYETYGTRGGYVVSPCDPAVIARQDQTRDEFTLTIPMDLMFEDQVGARQFPTYDENGSCAHPLDYTQGLVDVAARSASRLPIMSEGGYDRLSWYETGFCLSQTLQWYNFPTSTFRAYPMAPLWAHENLYFNAHNLAGSVMAKDLPNLTFYLAMGYSLSHDLSMYDADWLEVLDCFQKEFVAERVGRGMSAFRNLPVVGQSETTFADGTLLTANRTGGTMVVDDHVLSADGFVAVRDGRVVAGVLDQLNGQDLSGSDPHYLVIDPQAFRTRIYQPRGDSGNLTLMRPVDWSDDALIQARAVTANGSSFSRPVTLTASTMTVNYLTSLIGQPTRYYELTYCRMDDTDCNGRLDATDLIALADCLEGPDVAPGGSNCLDRFDYQGDLDVDMHDLATFQLRFEGSEQ